MSAIVELARPKVNLTLRVIGRRADGYHEIESLVAFASRPADVVTLSPGGLPSVEVRGPRAGEIATENILKWTLDRLIAVEPRLQLGAVRLDKQLPVAAGIGGGSADAAALVRAVRSANPGLVERIDWAAVAEPLGADVPVCLADRAAIVRGIGERVAPIARLPALDVVLVNPQVDVPADKTAQVFRRLNAGPLVEASGSAPEAPDLATKDHLLAYMRSIGNDLLPAAQSVVPETGQILAAIKALPGVLLAQMSGAGPTCYGVFASHEAAVTAAAQLRRAEPRWWVEPAMLG